MTCPLYIGIESAWSPPVEDGWTFFFYIFSGIFNKYAPIEKIRIKNRFSPWFDSDLLELLHLKNYIWWKARHTHTQADCLSFRQMRNKCTQAIRKAKVSYLKMQFSLCGSNPKKFWKFSSFKVKVEDVFVSDKKHMAELLNHHFIKSGFLFDSAMSPCPSNISSSPTPFLF